MSRYIDADALIDTIGAMIGYGTTPTEIWDMVNTAPSIDIVRCRECKYWNTDGCREGCGECEWAYYMTKPDDFCSYGERSE